MDEGFHNRRVPSNLAFSAIVIFSFIVADERAFGLYNLLGIEIDWTSVYDRLFLVTSWYIVPSILITAVLFSPNRTFRSLGLHSNIGVGLLLGGGCTLLMLIGYAAFGNFAPGDTPVRDFIIGSVFPGVGEEILYRGFLFGLLFRFAGWGFVPASLLGAALFGISHIAQGDSVSEVVAIVAITGVGAIWFAWLYVEWDYNLWVPITFHVLMNAYWTLFDIDDTALGGGVGNVFRIATIALSILITSLMIKRRPAGSVLAGRIWR